MTFKEYITSEDTESAFRFLVGAALPLIVATSVGNSELGIFMLLGSTVAECNPASGDAVRAEFSGSIQSQL